MATVALSKGSVLHLPHLSCAAHRVTLRLEYSFEKGSQYPSSRLLHDQPQPLLVSSSTSELPVRACRSALGVLFLFLMQRNGLRVRQGRSAHVSGLQPVSQLQPVEIREHYSRPFTNLVGSHHQPRTAASASRYQSLGIVSMGLPGLSKVCLRAKAYQRPDVTHCLKRTCPLTSSFRWLEPGQSDISDLTICWIAGPKGPPASQLSHQRAMTDEQVPHTTHPIILISAGLTSVDEEAEGHRCLTLCPERRTGVGTGYRQTPRASAVARHDITRGVTASYSQAVQAPIQQQGAYD